MNTPTLVGSLLQTSPSPIAAAHISLHTWWPLTQQAISFSPAIFSACKYFFDENLLDKKKVNYGSHSSVCNLSHCLDSYRVVMSEGVETPSCTLQITLRRTFLPKELITTNHFASCNLVTVAVWIPILGMYLSCNHKTCAHIIQIRLFYCFS